MKVLLLLLLYSCATKNYEITTNETPEVPLNPNEWIIDRNDEFEILWSMYTSHMHKEKLLITKLNNEDFIKGEKWTKKLTYPDLKLLCNFSREMECQVQEGQKWFFAKAFVKCKVDNILIVMNPASCIWNGDKPIVEASHTNTIIKKDKHKFMFAYGCHISKLKK